MDVRVPMTVRPRYQRRMVTALLLAGVVAVVSCTTAADPSTTEQPSTAQRTLAPNTLPLMADVPMYKADLAWSGVHPGPGPIGEPIEVWRTQLPCSIQDRHPTIGSGLVLVGCDEPRLFALDGHTGEIVWSADLEAPLSGAPGLGIVAVVGDGSAFVADSEGGLARIDLQTGETMFHESIDAIGIFGLVDGLLYVATNDGFHGLDPADASIVWSWEAAVGVKYGMVVGDTAFVASRDGIFTAVDRASRAERWRIQFGSGSVHSASVEGDIVYVAASQTSDAPTGEISGLDIATGERLWHYRPESGRQIGPCVADAGILYAPSYRDGLFAFDGASGDILWNVPTPEQYCPLAKVGDILYSRLEQGISARAASDGRELWAIDLGFFTESGPTVSGGLLIAGDNAGVVHAYAEPGLAALLPSPAQESASQEESPSAAPTALAASIELLDTFDASTSELSIPRGMDVGPDGELYVVNAGASEVLVLDPDGSVLRRWGSQGSDEGQFNFRRDPNDPISDYGGIAVGADGLVYVADTANRRIQVFEADGPFVRQWGRFGSGDGQFLDPIDLAVGPDGTVYVVDDQRDDIQEFAPDGTFLRVIGSHGTSPGQLNFTGGVYVNDEGTIYNADWGNDRAQAWSSDGASLWVVGGAGRLSDPSDVVTDTQGRVYVADRRHVQAFSDGGGDLIGLWEVPTGELMGMAAAGDVIYVSNLVTNEIHVLQLDDQ